MNVTRATEYLSVACLLLGGGLWLGAVQSQAADTAKAVDGLPEKVIAVETKVDERTDAIKQQLEDIKREQREQAKQILAAVYENRSKQR